MDLCDHQFSINICLSETWLTPSTYLSTAIPQYNHECRYRSKKSGGGVSIFIHNSIQYSPRHDISIFNEDIESIFVDIDKSVINTDRNVIAGCIYRPPKSSISEFNESLRSILGKLSKENKDAYLAGDFNIDLLSVDSHLQTSEFLEILFSFSFFPSINKPTRITASSATIIDNIFINNLHSKSITAGILAIGISDHFPVFCSTPVNMSQSPPREHFSNVRILSERNKIKFESMLRQFDWTTCIQQTCCQSAFSLFYFQYKKCFDECFPLIKTKSTYKNKKPWLTGALKTSIKAKNKLYRKYIKSKLEQDLNTYKEYKSKLKSCLRRAERAHYDQLFTQYKSNLRKSWALIKDLINKKSTNKSQSFKINVNGVETSNMSTITNAFNDYFVNIGPSLAQSIPNTSKNPIDYIRASASRSMYLTPVTELEITNIIREMRDCAPGPDAIPSAILKETATIFIPVLTQIINLSFSEGVFPNDMKCANITPLFKFGDKTSINNYRPISLLPSFSKIIEKCMSKRLLAFIDEHSILYKYQFGFRPKYSTNMAIHLLVDKIVSCLDKGENLVGVALDFRKAFDTVDHLILLKKLEAYGVRGNAYDWFASYLARRTQYVEINHTRSSALEIKCGVPQGSILGPILFLIYINDLPFSSKLMPIIFADDTNVFLGGKSINQCIETINIEMNNLIKWIQCNRLSLNVTKTNYIIFSKSKVLSANLLPLTINNTVIDRVYSLKFLGIVIDDKLSWSEHIKYIRGKISRSIGMLSCARKNLDRKTLIQLYYAFIYPYLSYCIDVWGHCSQQLFFSVFKTQKRALRIISFSKRLAHTEPLFKSFEILPLQAIYILALSKFMYKFYFRLLPSVIDELFQSNNSVHSVPTRQQNLLHVPHVISETSRKSIRVRGVSTWNRLAQNININSFSFNKFTRIMKDKLLNDNVFSISITQ
jgi:hypothetical protein